MYDQRSRAGGDERRRRQHRLGRDRIAAPVGLRSEGHECADINAGKSVASTAAFYFTTLADAYSTRTGRPENVGVIGVAFFRERPQRITWKDSPKIAAAPAPESARRQDAGASDAVAENKSSSAPAARGEMAAEMAAPAPIAKIGTGYGRQEESYVQTTRFVRASPTPNETIAIHYDRRATLGALVPLTAFATVDRTVRESVSSVDPAVRAGSSDALSELIGDADCAGRGPLAYWRAMPAPAIVAAPRDEDLMLAYAADDAAAFDALYARHKGAVYRYLLRQCTHAGVVDELFQEVWMSVIRSRASCAKRKFTTWLYRIAHHRPIDHGARGRSSSSPRVRTMTRTVRSMPFGRA